MLINRCNLAPIGAGPPGLAYKLGKTIPVTMLDADEQRRDIVEYYRRAAEGYDAEYDNPLMKLLYDPIAWRYIEPCLPSRGLVLDAGGGTGKWAIPIAKRGVNVVVCDLSSEMLQVALRKLKAERLEERIQVGQGVREEAAMAELGFMYAPTGVMV